MKKKKINKNENKKKTIIIIIIIALVLVTICLLICGNKNKEDGPGDVPGIDDKKEDDFLTYGDAIVEGYVILNFKAVDCGNSGPCTEDSIISIQDLVKFNINTIDNEKLRNAIKESSISNDIIQLGCLENDIITYEATADEYGPSEYDDNNQESYIKKISLSKDISKKILASTMDNPIKLKISRLKNSHMINQKSQCASKINLIEIVE